MSESTELALIPRNTAAKDLFVKPSKQDRARWYLFKKNHPLDEIAKRYGVGLATIKKSIDRMEAYNAQTSNEIVDMRRNEMAINLADKAEGALGRALDAQIVVRRESKKNPNKMVVVSRDPDYKTQLEASSQVQELLKATIPKGGGVNIAVQQNANTQVDPVRRLNFEELVRTARERQGLTNSDNVVEAEYENIDETAEDDEQSEAEE